MKVFAFDLSICNGCYCCQVACKDEHGANDWMPYAKPQPDTGQFWVKVQENVRGTVTHFILKKYKEDGDILKQPERSKRPAISL
jgi:Fe-S-cluster-containing dehydrogenase component